MLITFESLRSLAASHGIDLRAAYALAGLPSSAYSRHSRNCGEMNLSTYNRIIDVLLKIQAIGPLPGRIQGRQPGRPFKKRSLPEELEAQEAQE